MRKQAKSWTQEEGGSRRRRRKKKEDILLLEATAVRDREKEEEEEESRREEVSAFHLVPQKWQGDYYSLRRHQIGAIFWWKLS